VSPRKQPEPSMPSTFQREVEPLFAPLVDEILGPCLRAHGYLVDHSTSNVLEYRAQRIGCTISLDTLSYEIDMQFFLCNDPSIVVSLAVLVRLTLGDGARFKCIFQPTTTDSLRDCLVRMRELLYSAAKDVLSDEEEVLQRAHAYVCMISRDYTAQVTTRLIRDRAEVAWLSRDYATVVLMYNGIHNDLSEYELRRLTYAMRQLDV
jgi:hypothetical protein